ncbi:molybdate transport system permease protein [Clostridium acidisoli DSM 12555]|jgi:molybdate transport system permease protein|uniref:Molybdate transport system permease protein n=1 Tax=Clostridium acidisoli DSM 12555 TaxID=1121291 RepID=A0A1W1XMN1_9CLOT|nr:ABC transporter permease [Clostridium acidisoli]SMC25114.1 molybdate transport system permease protein [Clostridium acidisoli DSM 12555]
MIKKDVESVETIKVDVPRKLSINTSFLMEKMLAPGLFGIMVIYLVILIFPILSMIKFSGLQHLIEAFKNSDNISTVFLSINTSLIALLFTFILGTPTAFFINGMTNKFISKLLDIIVEMPVVLPPAVAGIALLLTFGSNGVVGRFLVAHGINIIFTPVAVVIAQFFVSSAFYVRVLRDAVRGIPDEIFEATYVMGAGKVETIFRIVIPMLKKSIISGLILAWIRSMGEFGATLMFAGNILHKTSTIPLQIYTYMQTDVQTATAFATVLYVLSFVMLILVRFTQKEN